MQGHAVEARLYAESPERGFMPGTGTLQRWQPPLSAHPFIFRGDLRMDAGVRQGDEVTGNAALLCCCALSLPQGLLLALTKGQRCPG